MVKGEKKKKKKRKDRSMIKWGREREEREWKEEEKEEEKKSGKWEGGEVLTANDRTSTSVHIGSREEKKTERDEASMS